MSTFTNSVLDKFGAEAHDDAMTTLPTPPTSFAPYEDWVAAATAHLHNAVDTARDELERDRDFLEEYLRPEVFPSPDGNTRQECIREAVRRFISAINDLQEGG